MSALSAQVCLFSAALCNIAVLDQHLFEQQGNNQNGASQQAGGGKLINTAANLFGNFASQAGIGGFGGGNQGNYHGQGQGQGNYHRQGQGQGYHQGQGQGQGHRRSPHQSPCGKKFQYVTDGKEWKGIIRIKNVDVNHDLMLEAEFVLPQGAQRRGVR